MTTDQEKMFPMPRSRPYGMLLPHTKCYDCDNYGHVAMDCPDKIQPLGMPACHQPGHSNRSWRSSSRYNITQATHGTNTEDLDTVAPNPDPMIIATGAAAATIPAGVDPDHSIGLCAAISHDIEAPVPITAVMLTTLQTIHQ